MDPVHCLTELGGPELALAGAPDFPAADEIDLLELVSANLRRIYEPEAVRAWLVGLNPNLGDRRPIDLVRAGKAEELMRAIRAERADSFA